MGNVIRTASGDRLFVNPHFRRAGARDSQKKGSLAPVLNFYSNFPGYRPTPLIRRDDLAKKAGVGLVLVKDESQRMQLGSFKVLGVAYALSHLMALEPAQRSLVTVTAATEGNHGKAVAWIAKHLGMRARVYIPVRTSLTRRSQIEQLGAEVILVDGTYQESIERMQLDAQVDGSYVVSDAAVEGSEEVSERIATGYQMLFYEVSCQMQEMGFTGLDLVFLQGGVGAFASSGCMYFGQGTGTLPAIVVVEPVEAACLMESAASPDGSIRRSTGNLETNMTCLNCEMPSYLSWKYLKEGVQLFVGATDRTADLSVSAMLSTDRGEKAPLSTSPSGSAGLAGLLALRSEAEMAPVCRQLRLDSSSIVLVINTEGREGRSAVD